MSKEQLKKVIELLSEIVEQVLIYLGKQLKKQRCY